MAWGFPIATQCRLSVATQLGVGGTMDTAGPTMTPRGTGTEHGGNKDGERTTKWTVFWASVGAVWLATPAIAPWMWPKPGTAGRVGASGSGASHPGGKPESSLLSDG